MVGGLAVRGWGYVAVRGSGYVVVRGSGCGERRAIDGEGCGALKHQKLVDLHCINTHISTHISTQFHPKDYRPKWKRLCSTMIEQNNMWTGCRLRVVGNAKGFAAFELVFEPD